MYQNLTKSEYWDQIIKELEKKINKETLDNWFSSTNLASFDSRQITLSVPNKFLRDWLVENYLASIQEAASNILNSQISVRFIVEEKNSEQPAFSESTKKKEIEANSSASFLNPNYTFKNFVTGPCNQFAHAASQAVSESPAKAYNPLFIYGGVGLGKTHLMHAIGHYILSHKRESKLYYISSEKFTNEFISSIQHDKMTEFRNKYRNMDVLLLDDIQFIAGKDRSQEEFFHTFNTLYESHKQIVLSSDRFPKEIPDLEERLRSRFECGLIADIQLPDLETKVAILQKKADLREIYLPQDVAIYIANKIKSNVRELEGCLIRVGAFASLSMSDITIGLAQEALKDVFANQDQIITVANIMKAVSEQFKISISELKSKKRNRNITIPRQIAMFLCRELTKHSLPEIGRSFGGKDHTTVIHSCNKVKNVLFKDAEFKSIIDRISKNLRA